MGMDVSESTQHTQHPTNKQENINTNTNTKKHNRKETQPTMRTITKAKTRCMHPFAHSGTKQRLVRVSWCERSRGASADSTIARGMNGEWRGTYPTTKHRKERVNVYNPHPPIIEALVNKAIGRGKGCKKKECDPPSTFSLSWVRQSVRHSA